jgi:hypothetical protein
MRTCSCADFVRFCFMRTSWPSRTGARSSRRDWRRWGDGVKPLKRWRVTKVWPTVESLLARCRLANTSRHFIARRPAGRRRKRLRARRDLGVRHNAAACFIRRRENGFESTFAARAARWRIMTPLLGRVYTCYWRRERWRARRYSGCARATTVWVKVESTRAPCLCSRSVAQVHTSAPKSLRCIAVRARARSAVFCGRQCVIIRWARIFLPE